jgi:hypothetical protein
MNPQGVVTGGWSWVVAVYAFTWFVLCGYALSLWWRKRKLSAAEKPLQLPPDHRSVS